ncbi:hypothetical protein MBLNU13_g04369t1 [Cladosporium sp. NU13]
MVVTNNEVDKIGVNGDSRVNRKTAIINGKTYGYLIAEPDAGYTRKFILRRCTQIHGLPDLSMGWRYQIPHLLKLGFHVIAPNCTGYGRSDAPEDSLEPYTFKSQAIDFHELCKLLGCKDVIVGAHDWACMIAYRFASNSPPSLPNG